MVAFCVIKPGGFLLFACFVIFFSGHAACGILVL